MAATFHISMFPWFAMGHLTPLLLANKLAKRGHKVSFIIPKNTQPKLRYLNRHLDLISFHSVTVPAVDGLPLGAESTTDVSSHQIPLIMTAMDELVPRSNNSSPSQPNFIFFDFTHLISCEDDFKGCGKP